MPVPYLYGRLSAFAALVICLSVISKSQAGDVIPFDAEHWMFQDAEVVEHLGRACLRGSATLKDTVFDNGVIEVDIAVDGSRGYPGLAFRIRNTAEYERFYLRPHRAGMYPDALQYAPVCNNVCCWQLYHGKGFTAPAVLPANEWIHVKMEISGDRARVYLNDDDQPSLVIDNLKHGESRGAIGVMDSETRSAYFSNFKYHITNDLVFDDPAPEQPPSGVITNWEVQVLSGRASSPRRLPEFLRRFQRPVETGDGRADRPGESVAAVFVGSA